MEAGGPSPEPGAGSIRWPEKYRPEATAIHVREEMEMPFEPEAIWSWLVRAGEWSNWYPEIKGVAIEGGGDELKPGASFRWRFSVVTLNSVVEEFVPFERLAWTARSSGIDAYHAWLIERRPSGCRVLSEETQRGWMARLNDVLRPKSTNEIHREWLERLLQKAKSGLGS